MSIFSTFQNTHRKSHCSTVATTLVMAALCAATSFNAWAQSTYKLSSKFYEIKFDEAKSGWDGRHAFPKVYCLTFPEPASASSMGWGLYNNNAIFYTDLVYRRPSGHLALYVVTSTLPEGRTPEQEIEISYARNTEFARTLPIHVRFSERAGPLGRTFAYTVRNAFEDREKGPFPLGMSLNGSPDAPLKSVSAHRMFAAGGSRYEVAGLLYLDAPVGQNDEAAVIAELKDKVEAAATSLEQCTARMLSGGAERRAQPSGN
jgi:hypothetical protein